ncbi:MAG: sodium:calcium antiporter [Candidatus Poseidoniaceae archaeon]|nr:sodium:calcium antiporter [Candidatus Poseidoniaceae archaeon]|tara:strand:- start:9353 stop:10483 length:1131 start_codon:yes stop_codon:yes gene_type:complete
MGSDEKVMGIPQLIHFQTMITTGALFLGIIGVSFLSDSTDMGSSLLITLIIACLALGLLVFSADFFIEGAKGLARRGGLPEVVIGLTIVSIGTSLPEILVTTTAAADVASQPEVADFAIGGILGSIFVQITLILGIVVVNKGFKIRESWLKRDGLIMLLAVLILTFFLLTERTLQRWESGILVLLYVIYIVWLLMHRKVIQMEEENDQEEVAVRGSSWSVAAYTIMVVFGLAFAIFAAHHLVEYARIIAIELNVPHAIVGTTVSGIGTSLPELTIALMAAKKSQGVAIGTLIGSNITDPLLSIGLAGLVHPLAITPDGFELIAYIIIPFTIIGCMSALLLMRTSYEIKKWEGYTLILMYIIFIITLEAYNRSWIAF